jgi:hypothetical protein
MSTRYAGLRYNEQCCSFCGNPHFDGEWRGNVKIVLVCRSCALMVLPALFADATWSPKWVLTDAYDDLRRFDAGYWKAQTINLAQLGGRKMKWPRTCAIGEGTRGAPAATTWLVPNAIPCEGQIVVCGPGATVFAQALVYALRRASKPARQYDARDFVPAKWPDASRTVRVFAIPSNTPARSMRLLCDCADCVLWAIDGLHAEVKRLHDSTKPTERIVSLRSFT